VKRTTVTIDNQRFAVPVTSDIAALKNSIEDAARRGGGFVDVPAGPNRILSVLVTPGLSLFIDEEDVTVDEGEDVRSGSASAAHRVHDGSGSYWPSDQLDMDLDI
jgi:hypothetical protein